MAKYSVIPNINYNSSPIFKTLELQKIEKIVWFKKIGDYLNLGDLLCEIHFDDCIFEMECSEEAYLLYRNNTTKISFSNILFIYGEKEEIIIPVFEKHKEDLKYHDSSNDFIFEKIFSIENIINGCKDNLID